MYKITIVKIDIKDSMEQQGWQVVAERLVSHDELERAKHSEMRAHYSQLIQEGRIPKINEYGHPPAIPCKKEISTQIYEQVVDLLDIPAVIAVINKDPYAPRSV